MAIEWVSFGVGALAMFVLFWINWAFKQFKKPKRNLHNFKTLSEDAAKELRSAYKKLNEIHKAFVDIESS